MPLVISVTSVAMTPRFLSGSLAAYELFISLVLSLFSLSLAENTLVTGLIITKILTMYRDYSPSGVGYANKLGHDIVPILIESAAITFMAQLVQTLTYKFDPTAFSIINSPVVILFVRGFTINCQC